MTVDRGERVLVTGGTGFLGRPTLPLLLERGHEVHVVSSRADADVPEGVHLHRADLLDGDRRRALLDEVAPTRLVHMAWYYRPRLVWQSLENLPWLEASLALLREFAERGGRRALLAGSCFEYDPTAAVCHEHDTRLTPNTLYGWCKAALGTVATAAGPLAELSVAWARIFLAYGPGEDPDRLVAVVARRLLAGEPAPVSHGRQLRDYTYSPDIADALVALLESDVTGPVNVGSGSGVTLRELLATLGEITGRGELIEYGAVTPPFDEPAAIVADVSRLRDEVGWTPRHSLREGLEETVAWWAERAEGGGG